MVAKGYRHTTLVIEEQIFEKLKDYAYTNRITQQQAINMALKEFLANKNNLLSHRQAE